MNISRPSSNPSFGKFSIISELNSKKTKNINPLKLISKIFLIILCFGIIIYLLIDSERFNNLFPNEIYSFILENYDSLIFCSKIINFLSKYHIFMILFIFGFCKWNLYKSFIHFFGFFICEYIIFILKFILRREPLLLHLNFDKRDLSDKSLNILCEYTSEYGTPSYRAAYVMYSYMSFITLLFKENNLKNNKKTKIFLIIIFLIFSLVLNASLIILLQSSFSSILIGGTIGFIIYFFMFNLLKIDYDRNEQILSFLNFNTFYYILINIFLFLILIIFKKLSNVDEDEEFEKFNNICGISNYYFKKMNLETFFKSFSFFCNLTMIICIKIQRKIIFKNDGNFISRNFKFNEIIEQSHLMAHITNEESYKFDKTLFIKYLCKVLLSLAIAMVSYLLFIIFKYFRDENYILFSMFAYILPINFLVIFLFLFSKYIFILLELEINNDFE